MDPIQKRWGSEETIVNEQTGNYCFKRMALRPGIRSSVHHHEVKRETFVVESGCLNLLVDTPNGPAFHSLRPGASMTIQRGVRHSFWSHVPTRFIEVSTFDSPQDSFRDDASCAVTTGWANRWKEWPGNYSVLVVGDVMLDLYRHVKSRGASPEGPRLDYENVEPSQLMGGLLAGGAGNVAVTLAKQGAGVDLFGVIGQDDIGEKLIGACSAASVRFVGLKADGFTTCKERHITMGGDVVYRLDRDRVANGTVDVYDAVARLLGDGNAYYDAIVVCDYGKGVVNPELLACLGSECKNGTPVFIDPKPRLLDKHGPGSCGMSLLQEHGPFTVVKPNAGQVREGYRTPGATPQECAEMLAADGVAHHVVLTAREDGSIVTSNGGSGLALLRPPSHLYGHPVDVSGAGDEYLAVLVACMLGGLPVDEAAKWATWHASEAVLTPRLRRFWM